MDETVKKIYTVPCIEQLVFTAEEIRTDLITSSEGSGLSRTWSEFLEGDENAV